MPRRLDRSKCSNLDPRRRALRGTGLTSTWTSKRRWACLAEGETKAGLAAVASSPGGALGGSKEAEGTVDCS